MTTPDLKPCPFCGGDAEMSERMDENIWDYPQVKWQSVSCCNIDCGAIGFDCPEAAEPNAVEAWNTRPAPTVQEAAKVLIGDGFNSPILEALDPYNNRVEVHEDVLTALRALAEKETPND